MSNDIFPYAYIPDPDKGNPIANGYIYIGEPDKDPENFPITVQGRQEDGTLVSLTQPIRTNAGGVPTYNGSNIVLVVSKELFSIKILNSFLSQEYYQAQVEGQVSPTTTVKVFDTVADMVADTSLFLGQKVRTLGYYAVGDGGGNDYDVVAEGTGTDDGRNYIDLSGVNLQAQALFTTSLNNVNQGGAKGNGVTNNNTIFLTATERQKNYIPSGDFLVTQIEQSEPFRLSGINPDSRLYNDVADKCVIDATDDGTNRNTDVTINNLITSQEGIGFTNNNFPAIKLGGTDNSYVVANKLDSVQYGISVKYGASTLGPYSGDPATEDQPKRAPRTNVVALNTLKEVRSMGVETFGAWKTRIIGNAIDNQDVTGGSHSYRFTGFPGIPCSYNIAQGNIGGDTLTGVSIQSAVHCNDLSGFVINNVDQGIQQTDNTSYPSYFSKLNRIGAIIDKADYGAFLSGPQHSEYNLIINETSNKPFFVINSTYGENKCCFFNVIARDANISSGAAIQIQTDNNIGKFIIDDSGVSGIRIDGDYNIIDVVVEDINGTSLTVTGNNNICRLISSNNAGTLDVNLSGDKNTITTNGSKNVTITGDKNIIMGHSGTLTDAGTNSNTTLLIVG